MQLSSSEFRHVRRLLLHIDEDGIDNAIEAQAFDGIVAAYEAFGQHMSITEKGLQMLERLFAEQEPTFYRG